MTPERWRQIDEVFNDASDRPVEERTAFLENACAGDPELRAEVESLLASLLHADARLRATIDRAAHQAVEADVMSSKDRRIGPYRLLRDIGEGGMGTVSLAVRDDDEYRTEVAIKLLHRGIGTAQAVARFRDERQILATLVHPGIVRLLDGGSTDDGLPYLVMEHVEGLSITRYADEHSLSIVERLVLFRKVCAAVAFAHQRLVVHRDLKPSNVLVTAEGVPKLLDFGIAKLLDPQANREARTHTGVHMFTPEYASPEQILGEPVTTAADVYSLGAVLYELCTGLPARKLEGGGIDALRTMIDAEPVRPSIVVSPERRRLLQGDIDAIILKALRKEPASRYASIEQLSLDIGRYLEGMPVLARSGTFTYRAGKLLRRSRGVIFIATTILVILSSATVISLGQADKAQKRFNNVRQLANAMIFEIDGKLREQGGATEARELMVTRALEILDSLAKEVGDDAELSKDIAAAYMKVGDIQGSILISNLGRPIDGLKSYEKAQELLNGLVAAGQQGPELRWALAQVHIGKGSLYRSLHEPTVAQEESLLGLELVKTLPQDGTFNYRLVLGARTNLWAIGAEDHDFEEMARQQGEIRDLADFWAKVDSSKVSNYWQAVAHQMRGRRSLMLGDPGEGAQALRESASILTALMAEKPEDPDFRREVWMVHLLAGLSQCGGGDTRIWIPNEGNAAAAEEEFNAASRLIEQDVERDPSNARARAEWMVTLDAHAWLIAEHNPEKAAEQFLRARKIFANLPAKTREQGYVRDYERAGQCAMAESLARLGRRNEALAAMKSGLALAKENATGSTVSGDSRIAVWTCTYQAGRAWMALGDEVQAERLFRDVVQGLKREIAAEPLALPPRIGLVETSKSLGKLHSEQRCAQMREASTVWHEWPAASTSYTRQQQMGIDALLEGCVEADEKNQHGR